MLDERAGIRVAANAVVVLDGRVLLVEFEDASGRHYNFPGGGVEAGETLDAAVRREVLEETSLEVTVERLLLVVESVGGRNTNLVGGVRVPWNEVRFFFACTPTGSTAARLPAEPDRDQTGVAWLPIDRLASAAVLPQVGRELIEALSSASGGPGVVANPHP